MSTKRIAGRLSRSIPWISAVIAVAVLGGAIRRKGFLGGVAHTALDAIPFVGAGKILIEGVRGRDFIRDRASRPL
jgi:hypothetical protein